jgi:glycosyltransferase involved in cell wall biosynthesis
MIEVQTPKVVLLTYVWPEPLSSAAGLRDLNLIESFLWAGWDLVVASPSQQNTHSEALAQMGVRLAGVQANDVRFDAWIKSEAPNFVIFDRFVMEEQFGWRVQEQCPNAVRVLDTQDLHFLRRTRANHLKAINLQSREPNSSPLPPGQPPQKQSPEGTANSSLDLMNEDTFREIGSIYRCDGVFVLSRTEYDLLIERFKFPSNALSLSRFHYSDPISVSGFQERSDFMMIGNFRHAPNQDGVIWMANEIWPLIRKQIPNACLNIYGAYPSREMMRLTSKEANLFVRGSIPDQFEVLKKHRVNLAPLRFGAGIKGKISDGWWAGTPVVSTSIGAEGMCDSYPFGGSIANSPQDFALAAVQLYQNQKEWYQKQALGLQIIKALYQRETNRALLIEFLKDLHSRLHELRNQNWIGCMLNYHSWRSTHYFSKWIEEKSKRLGNDRGLN